jgi:hypothetical protein
MGTIFGQRVTAEGVEDTPVNSQQNGRLNEMYWVKYKDHKEKYR